MSTKKKVKRDRAKWRKPMIFDVGEKENREKEVEENSIVHEELPGKNRK